VLLAPHCSDERLAPCTHCAVDRHGELNQLAQPLLTQCQVVGVSDEVAESLELAQLLDSRLRQKCRSQPGKLE